MYTSNFKSFRMGFNYKLAEEIISCFNQMDPSETIDSLTYLECSDSAEIIQELLKTNVNAVLEPQKFTLLHSFCSTYLYYYLMHERWFLLDDLCDDLDSETIIDYIGKVASILSEYGIATQDYAKTIRLFNKKYEASNYELDHEYKNVVGTIFDELLTHFDAIEDYIVDATFYLLYDNKEFLFKFNKYISQFVTIATLPNDCFDKNGHVIRAKYIPTWLKRAVYYRDRGRCQHCGKDLSGQFSIPEDGALHYDHIIPLEQGGTNDATNFQLLCGKCNLKKSGNLFFPDYRYQMYW